jgi:hypothetical protein
MNFVFIGYNNLLNASNSAILKHYFYASRVVIFAGKYPANGSAGEFACALVAFGYDIYTHA